jgi:hypothetical protein
LKTNESFIVTLYYISFIIFTIVINADGNAGIYSSSLATGLPLTTSVGTTWWNFRLLPCYGKRTELEEGEIWEDL